MEDDAGKSIHDGFKDSDRYTYVDLNRSGTPLIEIVSEPDMRSSDEAYEYLTELKQMMQYVGVSECDMEKGQLRCDANVSVRLKGAEKFGTKAEVKNLNSFRFAKLALDYEIARQVALIESGGRVEQETRLYNVATGETVGMRSKEHAHDYRYFPEPDLVPLRVSEAWLERIRAAMPELPADKRTPLHRKLRAARIRRAGVDGHARHQRLFRESRGSAGDPRTAANWVTGDLLGALKGREISRIAGVGRAPGRIGEPDREGRNQRQAGQGDFRQDVREPANRRAAIIDREGLRQISDTGALGKIVDEVIASNPKQVEQYKSGKTAVLGYLVGQVMKATKGQANPAAVNELLISRLS